MAQNSSRNGLLIINKPFGITSHTVVDRVRRLLEMKRVGHAGTLDPMATGVLVVLVGPATRLSQFLVEKSKHYEAVIHLGISTTTYDTEGEVSARNPIDAITLDHIHLALESFRGAIDQIPPMYSAIKIDGKKLYKLARQGKEIDRPARPVTIHALSVKAWEAPLLHLDVHCSSGTYIRSLAHDIGQALGCGAHLCGLIRSSSGRFKLEQSYTLEQLSALKDTGGLASAILAPIEALYEYPAMLLLAEDIDRVRNGQSIIGQDYAEAEYISGIDEEGNLIAVLIADDHAPGYVRPKIVFPPD